MLVLTRKTGEELIIGDDIRVVVNRIAGNRVAIGLVAPDDVRIVRGELLETVTSFDTKETPEPVAATPSFDIEAAIAAPRQAR